MKTGLDRLEPGMIEGRHVGLLSHYAAVSEDYVSSADIISAMDGIELTAILAPQHGFWGETQDNMIEWQDYTHPILDIPIHSLYSHRREPDHRILSNLDCLIVDLQDVGSRYYTYIYSMALCMKKCHHMGVDVVVLDRPNPLGFKILEGKPLKPGYESFVGMYPIPVRHGLTIGELARLFALMENLPEPTVITMDGWDGEGIPPDYPWVYPSPNMPSSDTASVYPGMCLLEATNLSEGRGTTLPFAVFGAPWLNGRDLVSRLNDTVWTQGAVLREHAFQPTFNKHSGITCYGAQIHVTDTDSFRPLRTAMGILMEAFRYPETAWNQPPYEYEYEKMPVDILSGGPELRDAAPAGNAEMLLELAEGEPDSHWKLAADALIYSREFRS